VDDYDMLANFDVLSELRAPRAKVVDLCLQAGHLRRSRVPGSVKAEGLEPKLKSAREPS